MQLMLSVFQITRILVVFVFHGRPVLRFYFSFYFSFFIPHDLCIGIIRHLSFDFHIGPGIIIMQIGLHIIGDKIIRGIHTNIIPCNRFCLIFQHNLHGIECSGLRIHDTLYTDSRNLLFLHAHTDVIGHDRNSIRQLFIIQNISFDGNVICIHIFEKIILRDHTHILKSVIPFRI